MKTISDAPRTLSLRLPALKQRVGETTGEFVHRRLRQAIMTGRFPPGVAVTIRGLAGLLGTSAMPVREAMRRLTAEHALDFLDNRRARVPEMTNDRFRSLIRTRVMLETEAADRAFPCIDAARLAELRRADQAVNDAYARGDVERTIETNLAFHRRMYTLAPDDVLTPLIESIWLQVGPFMRAALKDSRIYYRVDRHAEALAAIEAGDPRRPVARHRSGHTRRDRPSCRSGTAGGCVNPADVDRRTQRFASFFKKGRCFFF